MGRGWDRGEAQVKARGVYLTLPSTFGLHLVRARARVRARVRVKG